MVNMTNAEYREYVKRKSPPSALAADTFRAFVSGGVICIIGQLLLKLWALRGLDSEEAAAAASVTLVFIGAALTALGIYDRLAKFGGAGTLVPITGFANSVASPALEFKSEGLVTGTAVKMFTIAGPVIVYGTVASVLYGLVLVLLESLG
ncbi:MAG: stage V sporulation protein AC [Oscillospiraceae bacterium]|nr:stage V sporulation protein AC [Oscillospiraceae bacterium]